MYSIQRFIWLIVSVLFVPSSWAGPDPAKFHVDVFFQSGSATLQPNQVARLEEAACKLAQGTLETMVAVGHTDPSEAKSKLLSERRASAVVKFFAEKGFDTDKLQAVGKADSQPVGSNLTAEGRTKNRRVESEIIYARRHSVGRSADCASK